MPDHSKDIEPVSNAPGGDALPPVAEVRNTRSSALPSLAFLLASVAIGLQFYPDIRDTAEKYAGPLPWLPREILPVQRTAVTHAAGNTIAADEAHVAFEEVQADLSTLKTSIEQIGDVKTESAAALKAAQDADAKSTALSGRIDALEAETQRQDTELKASVSGLAEAYSKLAQPSKAPLFAARLVLLAVNGDLTPEDIDPLAEFVGGNPALAEAAGQLRALAGENIPTIAALQAQFSATKDGALQRTLAMRLGWVEAGWSIAHAALSDIGILRPGAEEKDEVVITEAARQMDSGNLKQALFELQAASPELKQQLGSWMSAAQLRLTLDKTLQQLVDGLLTLKVMPPDAPGSG